MNKGSLILFDYDGVIVDSLAHNVKIAQECAKRLGFDFFLPLEDIRNMDNMTFEEVGIRMGLSTDENEALIRCVFDRLTAGVAQLSVFSGIRSLLRKLSGEHILAVLTANDEEGVKRLLDHKKLSKFVSTVCGRGHAGSKSEKTQELMRQFKKEKERVYLIGDTISDIIEAKKAGVHSIAVTWGFQDRDRLLDGKPDFVVNSPEEIEVLFTKLFHKAEP